MAAPNKPQRRIWPTEVVVWERRESVIPPFAPKDEWGKEDPVRLVSWPGWSRSMYRLESGVRVDAEAKVSPVRGGALSARITKISFPDLVPLDDLPWMDKAALGVSLLWSMLVTSCPEPEERSKPSTWDAILKGEAAKAIARGLDRDTGLAVLLNALTAPGGHFAHLALESQNKQVRSLHNLAGFGERTIERHISRHNAAVLKAG